MTLQTKISSKGQIVLSKALRDRMNLVPGQILDVIETNGGVFLRPRVKKDGLSFDEATANIRKIIQYDGPPVTIEEMNQTIAEGWAKSGARGDW